MRLAREGMYFYDCLYVYYKKGNIDQVSIDDARRSVM